MYKLKLTIGGNVYRTEGKSVIEAVEKLKVPKVIKGTVRFKVTDGKKTTERMSNIFRIRRLLNNKVHQQVFAKSLQMFLK